MRSEAVRPAGGDRVAAAFRHGRPVLIPYVTAGHPRLDVLPAMIRAAREAGADLMEVGLPFSDPLADGPVLQAAAARALGQGVTVDQVFAALGAARDVGLPLLLLTYVNPVLARGPEHFLEGARAVGVDGLIVPDLPWAEARDLERAARARGMVLVPMAAPTSTDAHLRAIRRARGFVYGVSVTGVTGVRATLDPASLAFAARLKAALPLPVAIGFGIGTPEQARAVAQVADGVIVGSALVRALEADPDDAPGVVRRVVGAFRTALDAQAAGGPAARPD
jgi:tryptophan synthase alpha chain